MSLYARVGAVLKKPVFDVFLEHIHDVATGKLCLGFFGDKMQSIYDTGIVNIQSYVDNGYITEIIKTDNYRCSQKVIAVLNKLRSDLYQKPAKIDKYGVIGNKQGSAVFLYSNYDFDLSVLKKTTYTGNWDLLNPKETKLFFLTHKLIAKRNGWEELLATYSNNDLLLGKEPDGIAKHLLKLGGILYYYKRKKYDKVIENMQRKIHRVRDKQEISLFLSDICDNLDQTIDKTLDMFDGNKLLRMDDKIKEYIENHKERFEAIRVLPSSQVLAYFSYYNDYSPYSTQHGIKGAEFENVLVVMDNGGWNKYNFKKYFEGNGKDTVIERTSRIFYVCCSRAVDNLVVFYQSPSLAVLEKAKSLFGEDNVIAI